jgi:hypothetical protein
MGEPIITTGAALVGASAWFANKVFGPSAERLGDNLQVYLANRLPAIFAKAEETSQRRDLQPQQIKPGLLARMVVDASFSEDQPIITEWWANLFLDASLHGDNKHAVFSDMMAVIGPEEAKCLEEFITTFENGKLPAAFSLAQSASTNLDLSREKIILDVLGNSPFPVSVVQSLEDRMKTGQLDWPIRYLSWHLPITKNNEREAKFQSKGNPWFYENRASIEILERAGILRSARIEKAVWDGSYWMTTIEPTHLGMAFYFACHGDDF